ncbi:MULTISPECIES: DUF881 domain-containing protein [unclassified Nocardioides]|uniref:DUF881 domain-containing protein n=1 Tax=unclassified Nocardioides TaxID=2615069 RepID=UPI000056F443|nr:MULTISPECIES: DUF881 domain-containing protein [unclassified Nocardioides]ABL79571.1 protein of unknown function DUF881 [Nocardioides sp. JS614]
MRGRTHARPPEPSGPGALRTRLARRSVDRPRSLWRIGTPVVVLLCGALFVVSAANSDGTDLRPGRYTDLASLVQDEADQYAELQQRRTELNNQVAALSAAVSDRDVNRYQRRVEELKDPAGLVPRSGPGISVTLSDAPEDVINSTTGDINELLVHQQDIQAVVNALWKGGATAVTIAGQRIVSTTGIKCEGNAVQLQGVPYPQPYVIQAVGDQGALLTAIEGDGYVSAYREDAADPDISVGWELDLEEQVTAPAYDGLLDLNYAEPLVPISGS